MPSESQVDDELDATLPVDAEAQAASGEAQLEDIERDFDTANAALDALDADDLERAEELAAQLEGVTAEPASAGPASGGPASADPAFAEPAPADSSSVASQHDGR